MDNIKCEVIKDLLPLVVDEVASPETVDLVNDHMARCDNCRGYYEGMKAMLVRGLEDDGELDREFVHLGRKIRTQIRMKKWKIRILAIAIAIAVALGGMALVNEMVYHRFVNMEVDWADVQLYRYPDGMVGALVSPRQGHNWYDEYAILVEDGIVYIDPYRPVWPLWNRGTTYNEIGLGDIYWNDGQVVQRLWDNDGGVSAILRPITTIRWGRPGQYTTLYLQGEELPLWTELIGIESEVSKTPEASGALEKETSGQADSVERVTSKSSVEN